jgi:hypothetical protein
MMQATINPISVFDTSFINLPHLELATHLMGIGDAFIAHSRYQEVPEGVPHGTEIKEAGTRYHDLTYAVMTGTSAKKAERDACREKAVLTATLALNWAGMRYLREGDFALITDLGVDHKKKPQPRTTTPVTIDAPGRVEVVHTKNTGVVRILLSKVPGAVTYFVQACQGDPNDEAAWTKEQQFTKIKGGVEMTGLEPGKVYYFRVRCLGHAGLGPWSSYVRIMVT